jgi:hypothetical protein
MAYWRLLPVVGARARVLISTNALLTRTSRYCYRGCETLFSPLVCFHATRLQPSLSSCERVCGYLFWVQLCGALKLRIFVNVDTVFEFRLRLVRCYGGEFVSFVYPTLLQAGSQDLWRDFPDKWSKGRETCAEDTDVEFDCGPVHDRCALTLEHEVSVVSHIFCISGFAYYPTRDHASRYNDGCRPDE